MKLHVRTALVPLLAIVTPTARAQQPDASPDIPTQSLEADAPGLEIQTRDLRALARRIHAKRRAEDDTSEATAVASITRGLAEGVRAFVEPPLEAGEDVRLLAERYLVSIGRSAQQKWIDRFLRGQVTTAKDLVQLELHLFQADATALEKAAIGYRARTMSRDAGAELATALEKDRIANGTESAWLQMSNYSSSKSALARMNQVSYVKDFELVGKAGGVLVADPCVDVIHDGMTVDSTSFLLEGGRIGLLGKICFADLLRPFPTKQLPVVGGGAPITIQVPARRGFEIPMELTMDDGDYAALPGPVFEGKRLVAMLRARVSR